MYNVLFIDTENSARSIIAEALLNHWGKDQFKAYSAGSQPSGELNEHVVEILEQAKLSFADARSKGLDEFSVEDASQMDFVFILCDKAHGEICPIWPEHTITAVWNINSPDVDDLHIGAVRDILHTLESRINLFIQLPIAKLEHLKLQQQLNAIGQ